MKVERLNQIWSEADLAKQMGLPIKPSGNCSSISTWIRKGLPCIKIVSRRFFFEPDVIKFFERMADS